MDETPVRELAADDGNRVTIEGVGTRKVVTVRLVNWRVVERS